MRRPNPDWPARGYVGACVVVIDRGLVLGITRDRNVVDVGLPGGHLDPEDPSVAHGAAREAQEETGVQIDPATLRYVTESRGRRGRFIAFFAPEVLSWPEKFESVPFEGYVGFWEPAVFLAPGVQFADFHRRVFGRLGLI